MKPGDLVDITIRVRLDEINDGGVYWSPPDEGGYRRWTADGLIRKMRRVKRVRGKRRTRQGA